MRRLILCSLSTAVALTVGSVARADTHTQATAANDARNLIAQTNSPTEGVISPNSHGPNNRAEPSDNPAGTHSDEMNPSSSYESQDSGGVNPGETIISPNSDQPSNRANPTANPAEEDMESGNFYEPYDSEMDSRSSMDPSETIIAPNDNAPSNRVDPSANTLGDGPDQDEYTSY